MAKITTVFPVSNLWPERGGSAIKRMKTAYDSLSEIYRSPGTPDANVLVRLATKSYGGSKQYKKIPFLTLNLIKLHR